MTDPGQTELLTSHESAVGRSICLGRLKDRITQNKPPDILVVDIDGTLYKKEREPDGSWSKKGNNIETSKLRTKKNIADVVVSGRPDYDTKTDEELGTIGYDAPDVVVAGAGTVVYWRTEKGLEMDEVFQQKMLAQRISYQRGGKTEESTYIPTVVQNVLELELPQTFKQNGLERIHVDLNKGGGFTTLDIKGMSFEKLKELVSAVKSTISGVKVEFSEDLEDVSPGHFTGWMQIVPQTGGKDQALRHILQTLAQKVNPYNIEEKKKPVAHVIGDASIDIWMLAMGTGEKDPYKAMQYALGNSTPNAKDTLQKVTNALTVSPGTSLEKQTILTKQEQSGWRKAHLKLIDEEASDGVFSVINALQ